ncbi:MAG TPA: hypothetical protein VK982_04925 [Bacteroidales bacterium]|nr:hypothetical protein [Bacteroidales bacterium]
MARTHYWQFLINKEGQPIVDAEISVYEAGTLNPVRLFNSEFGSSYTSLAPQLTTNEKGYFEFWIADSEETAGYSPTQKFKIAWEKTGIESGYVDWIDILDFVSFPVDETDAANVIKNKAVSNALAYKWNTHTTKSVENEVVHGLSAVDKTSQDTTYNKLVSNKLIYDLSSLVSGSAGEYLLRDGSVTATGLLSYDINVTTGDITDTRHLASKGYVDSVVSGATSATQEYFQTVSTGDWTLSTNGEGFYVTITHDLGHDMPNVEIYDNINATKVMPSKIIFLNDSIIRIFYPKSLSSYIRVSL